MGCDIHSSRDRREGRKIKTATFDPWVPKPVDWLAGEDGNKNKAKVKKEIEPD